MNYKVPLMLLFAGLAGISSAQIVNGQIDTFTSTGVAGWAGAAAPTRIASGGPLGASDPFLQITSSGTAGPGSHLATFNNTQWIGNYFGQGITSIQMDLKLISSSSGPASLRLLIFGATDQWTSTAVTPLSVGGWTHVTFDIRQSALTHLNGGTATYASDFAGVTRLLLRQQAGTPVGSGTDEVFTAQMGIDNIRAVPEPATMTVLALGCVAALRRRKKS